MSAPQSGRPPFRRRRYIINKKFQYAFVAYTVVMAFAVIAVMYLANVYFFSELARGAIERGLPADHIFFRFVDHQRSVMNGIFAVAAALVFAALCFFGMFFSHRIAGPIYRMTMHLNG